MEVNNRVLGNKNRDMKNLLKQIFKNIKPTLIWMAPICSE